MLCFINYNKNILVTVNFKVSRITKIIQKIYKTLRKLYLIYPGNLKESDKFNNTFYYNL